MANATAVIWLSLSLCLCATVSTAQSDLLDRKVYLPISTNSLGAHVDNLQSQENITLAFNSSRVDLESEVVLPSYPIAVRELVYRLFDKQSISLTASRSKILIRFTTAPRARDVTVRGYIRDATTGEALVGASVVHMEDYTSTFSGETGFFSITVPADSSTVAFSYLGYQSRFLSDLVDQDIDVELTFDNQLTQVVIKESVSDNFIAGSGSEKIDLSLIDGFQSTAGGNDLIEGIRLHAGVQSGNEGQSGLYVRGGSNDQNLILFDGIPLYEVSHAAGFSSMFIEESIRNVDFIKNGFPARYGGRLSSVVNVQLKDGDRSGIHGSVSASLPSTTLHLEGPILGSKTTFNVSGRMSYIDTYLNQIAGNVLNYDIGLQYYDFVGKITHHFSPSRKISFSYYNGGDDLRLVRGDLSENEMGSQFETSSDVTLDWGSKVWNLNFNNVVDDKLQLSANVGGIDYRYSSRGSYTFESLVSGLTSRAELDVVSLSSIYDYVVNLNFDYYVTNKHVLKMGAGWIYHTYTPAVRSNKLITDGVFQEIESTESNILSDELSLYVEDTYDPHPDWQFYMGLHFSGFNVDGARYRNTQPRLSAIYKPGNKNRLTLSYTIMTQYVHLLVNPGIGLPSNLWVPSTDEIGPETARQVSLSYSRKLGRAMSFTASAYLKTLDNLLEYRSSSDLIFLGGTNLATLPLQEDPDWRKRVEVGSGTSRGIEVQLQKGVGAWTGWLSYSYAKAIRQFDAIDNGEPFPYKHDRRNDLSIGIKRQINTQFSIAADFVYGSGNFFSLSIEEFRSPFGTLRTSGARNNYQQQPYHHLDIQANYRHTFVNKRKLELSFGVSNIYDRRNAYFIYVYDSPVLGRAEARKTSLFPILPNLSACFTF